MRSSIPTLFASILFTASTARAFDFHYRLYLSGNCDHSVASNETYPPNGVDASGPAAQGNLGACISSPGGQWTNLETDNSGMVIKAYCNVNCQGGELTTADSSCIAAPAGCALGSFIASGSSGSSSTSTLKSTSTVTVAKQTSTSTVAASSPTSTAAAFDFHYRLYLSSNTCDHSVASDETYPVNGVNASGPPAQAKKGVCMTSPSGQWVALETDDNTLSIQTYCNSDCTGGEYTSADENCNVGPVGCAIGSFIADGPPVSNSSSSLTSTVVVSSSTGASTLPGPASGSFSYTSTSASSAADTTSSTTAASGAASIVGRVETLLFGGAVALFFFIGFC